MREVLSRLGQAKGELSLSFAPGRCGWLVTSSLELSLLRLRVHRFCRRVNVIHRGPSESRYFLEPNWEQLANRLDGSVVSSQTFFENPVRYERLRRLERVLRACNKLGFDPRTRIELFQRLALRLESLSHLGSKSEALHRHLGEDFDRLWSTVPLFAVRFTRFQRAVLEALVLASQARVSRDKFGSFGEREDYGEFADME